MLDNFYKLEYAPLIFYKISFYREDTKLRKKIFIINIVVHKPVKISNFKEIFEAQDKSIEILSSNKDIIPTNCIIYTILEARKGLKLIPDINMLKFSEGSKRKIEKRYDFLLNGIVLITPQKNLKRILSIYIEISNLLKIKANYEITDNYDEAYSKINKWSTKTSIKI